MATSTKTNARRVPSGRFLLGAIIVLIGVLLLLATTGLFPTDNLLTYVPSLFVLLGLWIFVQSGLRSIVVPVFLVGIGGAWQLVALEYATVDQVVVYWPVLVIAIGLSIALGQYRSKVRSTDRGYTSAISVLGEARHRNTSSAFAGGDLTAVFGSSRIDLRDAAIEERPARIDTTTVFGETEIVVPREWSVRMDVLPILGEASDDRPRSERKDDDGVDLIVNGVVAFGEVSVRD